VSSIKDGWLDGAEIWLEGWTKSLYILQILVTTYLNGRCLGLRRLHLCRCVAASADVASACLLSGRL